MPTRLLFPLLLAALAMAGCNNALCDGDGDGYCAPDDCDDNDPLVHPDREDVCDGRDDNCNGRLSDGEVIDSDGDGIPQCFDCDDTNNQVGSTAPEICDGIDNDCDGATPPDELVDNDEDGSPLCIDCDDDDPTRNVDAEEVCDGIDNNCDGAFYWDEEAGNGETSDDDGDGFAPCMGDCDDNEILAYPGNYEYLTDGIDNDCDGQGDNKPALSPENDFPENLRMFLEEECEFHGRTARYVDFEGGPVGNNIAPTSIEGFYIAGNTDGTEPYTFQDSSSAPGPFEGSQFAAPSNPVDGVTLQFDSPQTLVLWTIVGVSPGYGPQYNADIFWEGENLGGIETIWGTTNPDFTWNERGLYSFQNVAFEEIVIYDPVPGGEIVAFDNIGFCD